VVAIVDALASVSVAGNHDLIALGRRGTDRFSPLARTTLEWTRGVIDKDSVLERLPLRAMKDDLVVSHGSSDDPSGTSGSPSRRSPSSSVSRRSSPTLGGLVVGHTHLPLTVGARRGVLLQRSSGVAALERDEHILLCPGSVGQSRDRLPRARYMLLDLDRGEAAFRAIRYDRRAVRRALRRAGLPDDAYHTRPSASRPLAVAVVKRVLRR
jgi:Calcineurin-like phosphoesterase superfamily domain